MSYRRAWLLVEEINQTLRELGNRFDFKGTTFEVRREDHTIHLHAQDDFKLRALVEILQERMAKRQVPLKAIRAGTPELERGASAEAVPDGGELGAVHAGLGG